MSPLPMITEILLVVIGIYDEIDNGEVKVSVDENGGREEDDYEDNDNEEGIGNSVYVRVNVLCVILAMKSQ